MAKLSSINKNNRRIKLSNRFYKKRQKLKKIMQEIDASRGKIEKDRAIAYFYVKSTSIAMM